MSWSRCSLLSPRCRRKGDRCKSGDQGNYDEVAPSYECRYQALHHFVDRAAFYREARRVLRPGGKLLIVGLDPAGVDHWYIYLRLFGVVASAG